MSQITVPTSLNIDLEFNVAPFHKRLLAWVIDVVILFSYFYLAITVLGSTIKKHMLNDTADWWWILLIIIFPIAIYPLFFEIILKGLTVGKKLARIKVINQEGGNATVSQYLLRWLLRFGDYYIVFVLVVLTEYGALMGTRFATSMMIGLGLLFVILVVDTILVATSKKGQRMGDIAAGTLLINTKTENVLHQTVFMEVEENYNVQYPEVMKLSDRDMNTIKNIHTNLLKNYDSYLAANTASKIKSVLKISSNQEPIDFIETVLKDYNYLSVR